MNIRPVKQEEHCITEKLVFEVFENTTFSDGLVEKTLIREIREKEYYIPDLDLVVEDSGEIIAHTILSKFPISNEHSKEVLLLSPVTVAINKQRQGVGEFMLREAIKIATNMGYQGIVVEGDYRYYRRFGFRTSTEFGIYASEKNLPPSEEYLMALELKDRGLETISGEVDFSLYSALVH
ncbi:GNAT family N-acetyltransferase [Paenisporosarcina cavernae]|uniref:N-acetyltransferase n=1 Tax=Paenisporosarcina cavernae TaxID=2320858 RepID=A0A385YUD8_9BACL|nr:N-acetyltransferase [Paenisporosarcina cavernae]AYC30091.1 N-acetyltransferase [Paenisporosarcina cavernae]